MNDLEIDAERRIYSISEINRVVKNLVEGHLSSIWVEGEISNFKHHSSGHMYLSLKDEKAQISSVFFSRANQKVRFKIHDGLKVVAFGKVSVYEPRGQYQFYIESLQPKGMGDLQLAFMQLKAKLEKEGLFAKAHKKQLPPFPKTIGVVTSPTGAAIQDILNVLGRRFHGIRLLIYPVRVQGEGAAAEIARAIADFQMIGADVLIVGRGGGSLEDLWAFNEEEVARAIYESEIPIISAVGHEIDWTISDLAADLRAPTPSAAAELVVEDQTKLKERVEGSQNRMDSALRNRISSLKEKLERLSESYGLKYPEERLEQYAQGLDHLSARLEEKTDHFFQSKFQLFTAMLSRLEALSPLAVLKRGYSLTTDSRGHAVKKVSDVREGDVIHTRLETGELLSRILKKE